MCGIAGVHGIESFKGLEDATAVVKSMVSLLTHRGPDAEGVWSDEEHVVLGHRRLSILDTGSGANQPYRIGDDVLVFNGEVYNYLELRRELEASGAHRFLTQGDTEVVLAAFCHWGLEKALQRFNGMFALAWWCAKDRRLTLVRDRLGIKPLYWHQNDQGTLIFASEVRALMASGHVPKALNRDAIADQWMYGTTHAPETIVAGVNLLEPGNVLIVQDEELRVAQWWDPADEALGEPALNDDTRRHRIRDLLSDSVALRMRSDVAYGAFLSGGIDSSAVVGLMSEVTSEPLSTFSVTFSEKEMDESRWSREVAKRFGTDHHEIRLTSQDFLAEVPAGLRAMDHPSADGLNTYVVSGATRRAGVKVALSGLGGDELFAGYPVFERSAKLAKLNWLGSWPKGGRRFLGKILVAARPGMTSRKQAEILGGHYFDIAHTYPFSRQLFLRPDLQRMLTSDVPLTNRVFRWLVAELAPGKKAFGLPFLSQVSLAEMRTYMANTLLRDADQFGMAHALEVRVPFLDHRVVAAALASPDGQKHPTSPKRLLVEALDGLLPDSVVNRPKMGFVLPWENWLRGELKQVCDGGLQSLKDRSWVHSDAVVEMERSFHAGEPTWSWSRVWALAVLGIYLDRHGLE